MTEYEITMNQELRETYMNRVEVLDKVKKLFLIPGMEVMTTKQVADYFEVDVKTLQSVYQRNKSEVDTDGVVLKKPSDFQNLRNEGFQIEIKIANRGELCFSQRAILRIAMLLRDSAIAKEVRTQLLNAFENASEEDRVYSIDEEQKLWAEFGRALVSGDMTATLQAVCDVQKYHNRHIDALTKTNDSLSFTNKCLAKETRTWDKRKVVVAMIRGVGVSGIQQRL